MTNRTKIEMVGMGTKPDPTKFKILRLEHSYGNTIILANYEGCQTYGGDKLMLLRGIHYLGDRATLDPHFIEGHPVVARFEPTKDGAKLATICAWALQ